MKKRYESKKMNEKVNNQDFPETKLQEEKIVKDQTKENIKQNLKYPGVFNSEDIRRHINIRIKGLIQQSSKKKSDMKLDYNSNKSFYVDKFFNNMYNTRGMELPFYFDDQKIYSNVALNKKQSIKSKKISNASQQTNLYDYPTNIDNIVSPLESPSTPRKRRKSQIRGMYKVYLAPVNKVDQNMEDYMKKQFLHIQKMKPILIREQIEKKKQKRKNEQLMMNFTINENLNQRTNSKLSQLFSLKNQRQNKKSQLIRPSTQEQKSPYSHPDIKQFSITKKIIKKDQFIQRINNKAFSKEKIESYRDFLWKINFSNSIFVNPQQDLAKHYKVYIGPGNNSMLIKSLIKKRFWWVSVQKQCQDINFIWTQLKNNDFLKNQKSFKKKKFIQQTSVTSTTTSGSDNENNSKKQQEQQVIQYKDSHINIFSTNDLKMWYTYYEKNKEIQQKLIDKIYERRSNLLKSKNATKLQNSQNLKVHNHFQQNYFIGNKKAMFYSMRKYCELNNFNVFQYLPLTFHISEGLQDHQYQNFLKLYNEFNEQKLIQKDFRNIWIVKPGEFTNRGKGITVCSDLESIKSRIKLREKNKNGKPRTFIIQKYIQKPFLYNKRKFDIRHYMMITCINSQFKGYWYQQGYIRTTSYEYNISNCRDNLIHLTNDAIQKNTNDYGRYQKGNKISYSQFQKYLDHYHKQSKFDFFKMVLPKMKKMATDAIKSSYFLLDQQKKQHNFQIFGLDFMIDEQFKPWLIQINTNPCLELSCPLLAKIIPNMVENVFKIGLDPLFQPPLNWPPNKKYDFNNHPLENNKFTIVFDEVLQGQNIQQLYRNVDKIDKNMGEIEQENQQYQQQGKQFIE